MIAAKSRFQVHEPNCCNLKNHNDEALFFLKNHSYHQSVLGLHNISKVGESSIAGSVYLQKTRTLAATRKDGPEVFFVCTCTCTIQ